MRDEDGRWYWDFLMGEPIDCEYCGTSREDLGVQSDDLEKFSARASSGCYGGESIENATLDEVVALGRRYSDDPDGMESVIRRAVADDAADELGALK